MSMELLDHPNVPRYVKLAEQLRLQIAQNVLKPGDQLPSFTEMKVRYGVSQNTLERTNAMLEKDGLIVRVPGRGTFVAQPKTSRKTRLLGVMAPQEVRDNAYYAHLLRGVQSEAQRCDAEILLFQNDSPDASMEWERLDGLIVMARRIYGTSGLPDLLPAVSLMESVDGMASVTVDDYQGIHAAMEHLLSQGHRRIAYLGQGCLPDQQVDPASRARISAYRDALTRAGIAPPADWIRPAQQVGQMGLDFTELGERNMRKWLEEGWNNLGCTALLAQNDAAAIGAIEALQQAGIDVPRQVSVVGFDGLEIAKYFRPRLTTVRVPLEEVGARGAALLLNPSQDWRADARTASSAVLPIRLEIRDSTAIAAI